MARLRDRLEGRATGGAWLRAPLTPFALAFGSIAGWRGRLYDTGWMHLHRPPRPVISIGNLTAGGTGKTPTVLWLAEQLRRAGRRPAILLRGYGATDPERSDEARLYRERAPETPVYPGRDRVRSALRACQEGADLLLLDDGFQHRRLARDVDLVLLDATAPWGGGWPLPAGLLREWPSALARADAVLWTRSDQAEHARAGTVDALSAALARRYPHLVQARAVHAPSALRTLDGTPLQLEKLRGRAVRLLCAIGRPDAFAATVASLGARVIARHDLPDHHDYTPSDWRAALGPDSAQPGPGVPQAREAPANAASGSAAMSEAFADEACEVQDGTGAAWKDGARAPVVLTTEKDAVKLRAIVPPKEQPRCWVLAVTMEVTPAAPLLEAIRARLW